MMLAFSQADPEVVGIASCLLGHLEQQDGAWLGLYFSSEVGQAYQARLVFFRAN
jgi:hypothetical protein